MTGPVLLHIGCGVRPDLDPEAGRVLLVEPNPDHEAAIRAECAGQRGRSRLIMAAIAPETGTAPFHICNFADLSGLEIPPVLTDLMPGLKQTETLQVKTLSVADLLKRAGLTGAEGGEGHSLRCDAPGAVAGLIAGLIAQTALDRFDRLRLIVGAEPFFGPGSDADSVIAVLQGQGYRLLARTDETDPDWPGLHFRRDAALVALIRARDRAEAAVADLQAQLQDVGAARDAAQTQAEQQAVQLTELQDQITALTAEREAQTEQQAAQQTELQDQIATLTAEREAQQTELQDQITALTTEQEAQAAQRAELQGRIATLTAEQEAQTQQQAAQRAELQDQISALEQARDSQGAAAEAARADLGLALRMQALAEADLTDLQDRHVALTAVRDRQDALLGQLALQLGDVSDHLRQIEPAPDTPRISGDKTRQKGRT